MCYQVFERYSVCRCLYYKHAADFCAGRGHRGHTIQEKIVLVGITCQQHLGSEVSSTPVQGTIHARTVTQNSPASSNYGDETKLKQEEQDDVDGSLRILLGDYVWGGDKLAHCPSFAHLARDSKNLWHLLKAFEANLLAEASSGLERNACYLLQRRISWLRSKIWRSYHPHDESGIDPTSFKHDYEITCLAQELNPLHRPGSDLARTIIPLEMRNFVFSNSSAYYILKRDVGSMIQHNYERRMMDIIVQNIHPPVRGSRGPILNRQAVMMNIITRFLDSLAFEAESCILAPSHRAMINHLRRDPSKLAEKLRMCWARDVPVWRLYPPVPGRGTCMQPEPSLINEIKKVSEHALFEDFVRSSSTLYKLAHSISQSRASWGLEPQKAAPFQQPLRLSPPVRSLILSHKPQSSQKSASITFTCICGRTISEEYTELCPGGIATKERQLRILALRQQFQKAASQNSQRGSKMSSVRGFFSFFIPGVPGNAQLPQYRPSDSARDTSTGKDCSIQVPSGQHSHHFIHWCIPWSRYATRMSPLQSCQIHSDLDFFRTLRERYAQSKQKHKKILSFRKPTALRFVKFRLYHNQLVDIHEIDNIPPESQKHEYDYSPMPAETVPPIGPSLLMHFFMHPEESADLPILLPSVPKRKNDKLEPCPMRGSSVGWGIDVITGVDELKLFSLGAFGTLTSMIFGIVWSVVKNDIQGAFAVAGFFFTLFMFAIASLKALDF